MYYIRTLTGQKYIFIDDKTSVRFMDKKEDATLFTEQTVYSTLKALRSLKTKERFTFGYVE